MQSPFLVGTWEVDPRLRRIRNGHGWVRLEPRSMAVLCALAEAGGAPVSRDTLVEKVWAGRVVSDDAVNRQVAKLRHILGDDPRAPRYIETIPKTGFRLLAEVRDGAPDPALVSHGVRRWWPLTAAGAAAALALTLGLARFGSEEASTQELRQLTSAPGLEIHPSPSPSGGGVVYAARAAAGEDWDLFVQDADGAGSVRLTDTPGHDLHPAWAPDGERIAYLYADGGRCEIRLLVLYRPEPRKLADCRESHNAGGLGWSPDGRALYFADRAADEPFSLRRLDVDSGASTVVLAPQPGTIGDVAPRMAGDDRLAFLRVRTLGVEDAFLLSPGGELRRVTFDAGKIHGLAWYQGRLVVASNRRGGLFGLWLVDPLGGEPRRLAAPPGADGPGALGSTLVFEQWSSQVDLWSAPLSDGETVPVLGSTRWDWWPVVSPDGRRLAWTSDRSGAAELWVAAVDGAGPRRLTRFEGPYTQAAVWTPDGRALVVAAPVAGQFDLFRVEADTGATSRLTDTAEDEAAPVFAPDGRLLFRRDLAPNPVLMDEAGTVIADGVRRAQFGADGTLWFVRPAQPGLWRLRDGASEQVTASLETVDWQNWWVDDDGVYLIERPHPDRPQLVRLDPASGTSLVVRQLPDMLYKSGLARVGERVIYARDVRHESDLYALRMPGTRVAVSQPLPGG